MIIWIASYPKSGNTWVRSFLSSYYFTTDGNFNFDLLKNIKQFPSREFFKRKLTSINEAAENWLVPQREIKLKGKACFLKTHNVYGSYEGKSFTTNEFTLGAINIIRDPRNIITSLMNHYSLDENSALKMIGSVHRNLKDSKDEDDYSNYTFISSWSNNYNSWKAAKKFRTLMIKYEDLEINREETFIKIVKFINDLINNKEDINQLKLRKSIETTNFETLKKLEQDYGFSEAADHTNGKKKKIFFNLGNRNNYKKLLKKKTILSIEELFGKEMKEIGYL